MALKTKRCYRTSRATAGRRCVCLVFVSMQVLPSQSPCAQLHDDTDPVGTATAWKTMEYNNIWVLNTCQLQSKHLRCTGTAVEHKYELMYVCHLEELAVDKHATTITYLYGTVHTQKTTQHCVECGKMNNWHFNRNIFNLQPSQNILNSIKRYGTAHKCWQSHSGTWIYLEWMLFIQICEYFESSRTIHIH